MTDILVIGGGVAGLSAAAALSEDATVTVFEGEAALGYHASGRSAALFEEAYGSAPVRALNRASRAYHEAAGVLSPRGFLMVGLADEKESFAADLADMGLEEVSSNEARAMVPILSEKITFAGYESAAMDVDVDRLMQGYARTIRANGGTVRTLSQVGEIARIGGGWQVRVGDETHEARTLVNAGGAWADDIARLAGVAPVGLQPFRRSMARLPAPGGQDVTAWPMIFGPGETWYAKPDAGALLVSPAEEDPVAPMDAWADDMVIAEGLARYEARVTEPVQRLLTTWAGLRTFAPDRALVLGRDPVVPDFVWVAGQGGYGVQTSPAAGRLVADLVNGRQPELDGDAVRALSPSRF